MAALSDGATLQPGVDDHRHLVKLTWSEILDLCARILRETTDARLDAKRGTSDQPGSPARTAPASILICGSLPGGLVCRCGRFTSAVAQRFGMITFLAGMIGIITAINAGTLALFIIATIVAGAGQGIVISGTTRGLLHGSTLADRAPIFSAIYLVCYSGATFPSHTACGRRGGHRNISRGRSPTWP